MANRRSGRGKVIDKVRWTGDTIFSSPAQAASIVGIELFQAPETEAFTIMRTRGIIALWLDGAQATSIGVHTSFGLHVVPKGTDSSVTSSPIGEAEADWFAFGHGILAYEEMVVDAVQASGMSGHRFEVDSKAMRKMKPGQEIQLVLQVATVSGLTTSSVNWAGQLRFLLGS